MEKNGVIELLFKTKKEDLYDGLIQQLEKDFLLANVPLELNKTTLPDQLHKLIKEKLYVLLMERFEAYLNLLYVIDVPENSLKNINVTDAVEVAEQASFLILKRECEKIMLKKRFGDSTKNTP